MEQFQLEQAEHLARIEENVAFLKTIIVELKEQQETEFTSMHKRVSELETFKDAINTKIAYIGGVLVTIGMAVPYALNWVASHISWKNL